jgi:hypothetical protein
MTYASGYGLQASARQAATTTPATAFVDGAMNIGVPSQAAASKLLKTQTLTEKHEVIGYFSFLGREWANHQPTDYEIPMPTFKGPVIFVTCFLHGLIKTAVNK